MGKTARESLLVLKIGGKLIEDDRTLEEVLRHFARIPVPRVLVHGGGKEAGILSEKLGIPVHMVEGRRVTDAETLKVATMVYGGLLNKKLVSRLQAFQCNALGLSGADGNSILAHNRVGGEVDFGFAGDVDQVNTDLLARLIGLQLVPVFCALTHDGQGQILNTNADTVATEIAKALSSRFQVSLLYCFDKPGVLTNPDDDSTRINRLDPLRYTRLRDRGAIHAGMLPKLDNAFSALTGGVHEVVIGGISALKDFQSGTRIIL